MLGSPIAHSLSPVLHRAAYDDLGLGDWDYSAIECDEPALADTLHRLDAAGLAGVSLTMPLKRAVLPLLARCDRLAADVAAANTVVFGRDGEWWGANTDVPGMVAALRTAGVDRPGESLILGAGATAASAIAALAALGAAEVSVAARRPEQLDALAAVAARFGIGLAPSSFERLGSGTDLVISTLPAGAADPLAARLPGTVSGVLFDVVYAGWPTPLAAAWESAGGRVVGGLELLVRQAIGQVVLMTGREPDVDVLLAAGRQALLPPPAGIH